MQHVSGSRGVHPLSGGRSTQEADGQADVARAVARLSTDYVLRALRLLSDLQNGEMLTAIVRQAIVAANTSQGDAADPARRHDGPPAWPPDKPCRPVSILALSGSLGIPFETTRRHVNKLIAAGVCKRVRGGVVISASALDDPAFVAAAETNLGYVLRFVRGLRQLGVDVD